MSTRKYDSAMSTEDFLRKVVFSPAGNQNFQERTLMGDAGERNPSGSSSATGGRWGLSGAPAARGGAPISAANDFQVRVQTSPQGKIAGKQERTPGGSVRYQYDYDAEGRLARVAREGRLVEDYAYNAAGQRIAARNALEGRIRARSFAYNEKGQLVAVREDAGGVQDGAAAQGVTRYFYDGRGSLRVIEGNGWNTVLSYGNDARLDTAELPDGRTINYVYGPRLMPEKVYCNREPVLKYHWLDDSTLGSSFDVQSGLEYTFHYGPHDSGQRGSGPANARRRVPTAVTIRGEGLAPLRLTPTQRFGYAGSGIPQGREDEFLPDVSCLTEDGGGLCLTLAIGADQVGSIRTLCDRSGNIIKEITYDSFGNVLTETRPQFALPLGFACGLKDPFTGFVRFGHRDYDPGVGRFTALDPARDRRGDGDLYDYCADDPVSRVDPAGLEFTEAQARAGGASHAGISHPFEAKQSENAEGESDFARTLITNLGPSAKNFAEDLWGAVQHPIDTGSRILDVASGYVSQLFGEENEYRAYSDAMSEYFSGRYGSAEGFKKALAQDPVGVAGDLSSFISFGGGAARSLAKVGASTAQKLPATAAATGAARAAEVVGKAGSIAGKTARVIDPLTLPGMAVKKGVTLAKNKISPEVLKSISNGVDKFVPAGTTVTRAGALSSAASSIVSSAQKAASAGGKVAPSAKTATSVGGTVQAIEKGREKKEKKKKEE